MVEGARRDHRHGADRGRDLRADHQGKKTNNNINNNNDNNNNDNTYIIHETRITAHINNHIIVTLI